MDDRVELSCRRFAGVVYARRSPSPCSGSGINGLVSFAESRSDSRFVPQPHLVSLDVKHHGSAFVDEALLINVNATNDDERDQNLSVSVFMQPADEEDCESYAWL